MYRLLVLTALAQLLLQHALLVIANPVDAALPFEARRPLLPPMDSEDDRPFRPSEGFQKAPRKRSLAGPIPGGVRKMSGDEGEKFYMEYWQFGFQEEGAQQPMMLGSEQQKNDDDEDKDLHARTEHLRSRSMDDQQQEQELQQSETTAINGSMSFPPPSLPPALSSAYGRTRSPAGSTSFQKRPVVSPISSSLEESSPQESFSMSRRNERLLFHRTSDQLLCAGGNVSISPRFRTG